MKKSLFILALLCATTVGAFASTKQLQSQLIEQTNPGDSQTFGAIDLGNGYSVSGTVLQLGDYSYSYIGYVSHNGQVIGTVNGFFQTQLVDGNEVMVDGSLTEVYSNDEVANALNTKPTTVKNSVGNVR